MTYSSVWIRQEEEHMGHDLLVLDSLDNSLTLFTPTEYGNKIYDAIEQFQNGDYEESGTSWQQVKSKPSKRR